MSSANAAAAQALANRAASGGPLDALLQQFEFQEAQELLSLIMSELAAGINPRQMASDISNTLDSIDYGRAETIARTESLTSWNDAALANYQANSDIVGQWMWMCTPGAGTCVSCLEEDGTIYGLDEELDDHPNGRCCKAPVTNDYGSILDQYGIPWEEGDFGPSPWDDRQSGEDWLLAQDAETQRAAFGSNAAYNAWKSGDAQLKDFVKIRHDPIYGDSIQQQSLRGMGLNARDYSAGSMAERAAKDAEAKAAAEREAELARVREDLATAQARWETLRGDLPEHPLYVSDSGAPGAVPAKVMQFSDYAEQRRALLELWDAQALADAARGVESAAGEAAAAARTAEEQAARELAAAPTVEEARAAEAAITVTADDAARASLSDLFGRDLSDQQIGDLVGARAGDRIEAYTVGEHVQVRLLGDSAPLADGSPGYNALRSLSRDPATGELVMENGSFFVDASLQGQGIGIQVFSAEAANLSDLGVARIETEAIGWGHGYEAHFEALYGEGAGASLANGYYTWARFGYDGAVPWQAMFSSGLDRSIVPENLRNLSTIQEIMHAEGGPAFWREWGWQFSGGFDLAPDSASMRLLREYQDAKAATEAAGASELALREGEGAATGGHAADDALTARIDRIPADATVPDIQDWLAGQLRDASQLNLSALDQGTRDYLLRPETIAKRVNLMELDAQTARLIANATVNLTQALPEVLDHLYTIEAKETYTEALAFVPRDGLSVIINTEMWTDLAGLAERTTGYAEQGWWVATTPEDIIGHEIGHAVQIDYKISNDTWIAASERVAAAGGDPLASTYAGRNVEESFAETFALLVYGEPTDAQLPIVQEMARLLRENGIDYNDLRAAVGVDPFDVGFSA